MPKLPPWKRDGRMLALMLITRTAAAVLADWLRDLLDL